MCAVFGAVFSRAGFRRAVPYRCYLRALVPTHGLDSVMEGYINWTIHGTPSLLLIGKHQDPLKYLSTFERCWQAIYFDLKGHVFFFPLRSFKIFQDIGYLDFRPPKKSLKLKVDKRLANSGQWPGLKKIPTKDWGKQPKVHPRCCWQLVFQQKICVKNGGRWLLAELDPFQLNDGSSF